VIGGINGDECIGECSDGIVTLFGGGVIVLGGKGEAEKA
jgi:hypothetical protein